VYESHGRFVSPILRKGQSWTFTFNGAATY
jgi:hypothetical protein